MFFVRQQSLQTAEQESYSFVASQGGDKTHLRIMKNIGHISVPFTEEREFQNNGALSRQDKSVLYGRPLRLYPNDFLA